MVYEVKVDGFSLSLELTAGSSAGEWMCRVRETKPREPGKKSHHAALAEREYRVQATLSGEGALSLLVNGKSYAFHRDPSGSVLVLNGQRYEIELRDPRSLRSRRAAAGAEDGPRKLLAP